MMQDEQIIDLYFDRNERALMETSEKYGNYCRTIARTILNDEETVKECFNDTLFHSWNAMPPHRPNCLKTFVGKITRNVSLQRVRASHAVKRGGGEAVIAIDELEECIPDHTTHSAEQITEELVVREVLDTVLADLPVQKRRVFVRRYWYCNSIEDIAKAFDMTEGSVRTCLSRVRSKLRSALEEAGVTL
ncbi:MAG: sigma-70 family RNA polymerase sigma factor [Lachnospiraceae bacterium]|jgi:RNA polymerase sigma-70 factor (ECF subfamily)|nr:sigma-70 family RNA polymerase sigma factor [Lachnospiraceae bacterium]